MTTSGTDYKSNTHLSKVFLKHFSHSRRFDFAVSIALATSARRALDFGGGNGAFLTLLKARAPSYTEAVLYEPYMDVEESDSYTVVRSWDNVVDQASVAPFDLVFCLEVMEHLSVERQLEALKRISSVMRDNGLLIISVPVEFGPVALLKNIYRWKYRRNSTQIYNYRNLFRSLFAQPIPAARSGADYLTHMGFYYPDFEKIVERHFFIEEIFGSPFDKLPSMLNSQVFFRCRPASRSGSVK